jgi:hypothetical protein
VPSFRSMRLNRRREAFQKRRMTSHAKEQAPARLGCCTDAFLDQMKGKQMNRFESLIKPLVWSMALLLSAFAAGCGDPLLGIGSGNGAGLSPGPAGPAPVLGTAAAFGGFGGNAGMTNQGISTVITGAQGQPVSIGTTAASTLITGFHDLSVAYTVPGTGCSYTETGSNIGRVDGTIDTAAPPPTVQCPAEGTAATAAAAGAAAGDALIAYNDLAGRPGAIDPGANLSGLTLAPGVYKTASGAFLIQGGADLTLDAQGNPNAVWVFQMATTLTVGGPGVTAPRSVILAGGAQPKNVFWQVGSAATINAAGGLGGTMVGTIISSAATSFSTAGQVCCTTLNGRALALNASVTMVNTVINVPAP